VTVVRRHPEWIKARAPVGEAVFSLKRMVRDLKLHTVCEEAACPNLGECWSHGTATFMLMGDVCTRNCAFCAVAHGRPVALDPEEPERVGQAIARLGLRHVVVTSVDRDDLVDGGAAHFAATAAAIRRHVPDCSIEFLVPDFKGRAESIDTVVEAEIDILNHNTETVPRLYPRARAGARYDRSLDLLRRAKDRRPGLITKTGLMLGIGEERDEVVAVFADLAAAGCDILTLGQYLSPSREHLPVSRYLHPDEFAELRGDALRAGLRHVESGPLVRSSYHAWDQVQALSL
jgi:lipoic acid synthetase